MSSRNQGHHANLPYPKRGRKQTCFYGLQRIKTPWEIDGILQEAPKEFTINFQKLLELGAHTGFRVEDHTPWVPGWSFPVAAL